MFFKYYEFHPYKQCTEVKMLQESIVPCAYKCSVHNVCIYKYLHSTFTF